MTERELLELLVQKVTGMDAELKELKSGQQRIETAQLRMENEIGQKIGALKDGFEMRGDQIGRLQEHLDERLDSIQNDLSYVVGKVAQHDRKILQIAKLPKGV